MTNGWDQSARAWIKDMGEHGDFGRRYVLDKPMLARAKATGASTALDVGCGEGRFCRLLEAQGSTTTGLDPTTTLLDAARDLDPNGRYIEGVAEHLPFDAATFDLVVSYLTLIDIPDIGTAIPEMVRVLKPGGKLLVANLNSFKTAAMEFGWIKDRFGHLQYHAMDRYLETRGVWTEWRGIRIINHHRPLSAYMQMFLSQGLKLTYFDEPTPSPDAPIDKAARYCRAPWYMIMEWEKRT